MTDNTDPTRAAIQDARALLDAMLSHEWQEVHVISGGTEIFIARAGGRANPMRVPPVDPAPVAVAPPQGENIQIKAPHVATLVSFAPLGHHVSAGDTIAVLQVLDEEIPLLATGDGMVDSVSVKAGNLVEYDMPILTMRGAA